METSLERALSDEELRRPLVEDLFALSLLNPDVQTLLLDRVGRNKVLMTHVLDICRQSTGGTSVGTESAKEWRSLWNRGLQLARKRQQQILDTLRFLDSQAEHSTRCKNRLSRFRICSRSCHGNWTEDAWTKYLTFLG